MDLSARKRPAKGSGCLFGLQDIDCPACLQVYNRAVFHLDKSDCGILYLKGLRIPRPEQVALCRLLQPAQLIEHLAGDAVNLVVSKAPQGNVQCMGSDVDQWPAALSRLVHEYAPGRNAPSAQCMCLSVINLSQVACLACAMEVQYLRTEPVLVAYRKLHAALLPCLYHLLCLFGAMAHRLFYIYMLAGLYCLSNYFIMCMTRSYNRNSLYFRIIKYLV